MSTVLGHTLFCIHGLLLALFFIVQTSRLLDIFDINNSMYVYMYTYGKSSSHHNKKEYLTKYIFA